MAVKESGYLYPHKMARIHVLSIVEIIGHEAITAVFRAAGILEELYPPANVFAKDFDCSYTARLALRLKRCVGLGRSAG